MSQVAGRIIKTYVRLFNAARLAIRHAEESEEDEFYNCMSCILFCALCIEAYLNHVGITEFQYWEDDLEKKLSPTAKLRLIASERIETALDTPSPFSLKKSSVKISIDFSRRPFQSFPDIIRFRNDLAHGKTEVLFDTHPEKPLKKWEKLCTVEHAKRLLDDTEQMIRFIHSKVTDNRVANDPFEPGIQFGGFVNIPK